MSGLSIEGLGWNFVRYSQVLSAPMEFIAKFQPVTLDIDNVTFQVGCGGLWVENG